MSIFGAERQQVEYDIADLKTEVERLRAIEPHLLAALEWYAADFTARGAKARAAIAEVEEE